MSDYAKSLLLKLRDESRDSTRMELMADFLAEAGVIVNTPQAKKDWRDGAYGTHHG